MRPAHEYRVEGGPKSPMVRARSKCSHSTCSEPSVLAMPPRAALGVVTTDLTDDDDDVDNADA